ncbi:MAG: tetratricopeptide repeat protein [Candidatus Xenobia bacterium]
MSDDFELLVLRAEWLHDSGELQHALDAWTDCVAANPTSWEARLGRAKTYLRMDQPAAAAIDLRRALDSAPEDSGVRSLLEACEAKVGRRVTPAGAVEIPLHVPAPIPATLPAAPRPMAAVPVEPRESVPVVPPRLQPGEIPTLQSVAGQRDFVAELRQALNAWGNRRSSAVWGLGLVGPPGTGRRFLAHCLAGELEAEWIEADAATMAMGLVAAVQGLVLRIADTRGPLVLFLESPDLVGVSDRALLGMLSHSLRKRNALLVATSAEPWLWEASLRRTLGLHRLLLVPVPDEVARRWFLHDPDPHSPYQDEVNALVERTEGFTVDDLRTLMGPAFPLADPDLPIDHYLDDRQFALTPPYLLRRLPDLRPSGPRWLRQALREKLDEKLPELADPLHALADRFSL